MAAAVLERRGRDAKERHDANVNLRMPTPVRSLIDMAAAVVGKSRSEFITESAHKEAIDVLLDQRLFQLSPERFDAFQRALDTPPPPNEKLKKLMRAKPLWEK